jgi:hypothetical protein
LSGSYCICNFARKRDLIMSTSAPQPDAPSRGATFRAPRRFVFERDSFAFANELIWEYRFDAVTGKTTFARRDPKPAYAHRCFVLTRAARQFLYHVRFDAGRSAADDATYRRLVREAVSRDPRMPCQPGWEILIPGYASLRQFSQAQEQLLKSECGGAWRSYVLRSHWRMVFPVSRQHQARTAAQLVEAIQRDVSPIIHLVRFPRLSINHGMVLFDASESANGVRFKAYDPNDPEKPTQLSFDRVAQTFLLPANRYWAGGCVKAIEIYRRWFL